MDDMTSPNSDGTATTSRWDQLPGLDDDEQNAWQHFLNSSTHLLETLDHRLRAMHRLSLLDVRLLSLLAKSQRGAVRMSELAHELTLIPSRVTAQVGRLESEGLVSRHPCPDDRRCVIAHITQHGMARLAPALRTYAHTVRALYLNPLDRRQMTALGHSCGRISEALRDESH